uniref:Uncharacterized protein n=1 Tax=Medicago truncatula TaxID=3880 RepID=A2Q3C6_MEDTR|nr:hypothetical protein MtrDRAFT_AC155880g34v2 [Medicago truncatula]
MLLKYVSWGLNDTFSDYIIRNPFNRGSDYIIRIHSVQKHNAISLAKSNTFFLEKYMKQIPLW